MLGRAVTFALVGLEPRRVEVEAHLRSGQQPSFSIVGLADRACQEAKHRVRSGVHSALLEWPGQVITVNLAPAALRKEGTGFDLAIALTLLAASGQVPPLRLATHACVGELGLDGAIRPVSGVIAAAEGAARSGLERVLCPAGSASEAALAGIEAIGVQHLRQAVGYLRGDEALEPASPKPSGREVAPLPDLADVRVRNADAARSSSRLQGRTTSCSRAHLGPGRRCSPGAFRRSSRSSGPNRRWK